MAGRGDYAAGFACLVHQWERHEELNILKASRECGMSRRTLRDHFRVWFPDGVNPDPLLLARLKDGISPLIPEARSGRPTVLSGEIEEKLAAFIVATQRTGMPLTAAEVLAKANKLLGITTPDRGASHPHGLSRHWVSDFMKRRHLSLRRAEVLTLSRARACTPDVLEMFYHDLDELYKLRKYKPRHIMNGDEFGFKMGEGTKELVIVEKGTKDVYSTRPDSSDRVSVMACATSTGMSGPLGFFIPDCGMKEKFRDELALFSYRPDWYSRATPKGWMNQEAFVEWIHKFADWLDDDRMKVREPGEWVLLLLDQLNCHFPNRPLPPKKKTVNPLRTTRVHTTKKKSKAISRMATKTRMKTPPPSSPHPRGRRGQTPRRDALQPPVSPDETDEEAIRRVDMLDFCAERHIDVYYLPPNLTHKLQPLDVGVFSAVRAAFSREQQALLARKQEHERITFVDMPQCFIAAWAGCVLRSAPNAFEATGIYPLNPHALDDDDALAIGRAIQDASRRAAAESESDADHDAPEEPPRSEVDRMLTVRPPLVRATPARVNTHRGTVPKGFGRGLTTSEVRQAAEEGGSAGEDVVDVPLSGPPPAPSRGEPMRAVGRSSRSSTSRSLTSQFAARSRNKKRTHERATQMAMEGPQESEVVDDPPSEGGPPLAPASPSHWRRRHM